MLFLVLCVSHLPWGCPLVSQRSVPLDVITYCRGEDFQFSFFPSLFAPGCFELC